MKMLSIAALLIAAISSLAAAETPWPATLTNPKPLPGDFVLPMPCGGQMVFRAVLVPGKGALEDQRMVMGGVAKQFGYKEYQHAAYIAGGFTGQENQGGRLYYLGKYDVTRLQFAAFGGTCPTVDENSQLPQTSVSWIQSVDFADAYTGWLIAHEKSKLPVEGGQPGFLRLPTEEEWEYAARGGAHVSPADFAAPLFPMTQPLAKYVWYSGTESSNGQLQPVGLLLPNPLGLFDMLGNAAQLTGEQFRLNRLSRMNGDAGGYVVRGGSYLTPAEQIRSSARDEFVPYDGRGPRRLKTVGFRLALVAPAMPNLGRLHEIETEWAALPNSAAGTLAEPVQDDPVKEADVIARAVENPELKRRLESLEAIIAANIKTRNDQRDRAARASLALASWLGTKMKTDAIHLMTRQRVALLQHSLGRNDDDKRVVKAREELDSTIATYRDTLRSLYTEYPSSIRDSQSAVLRSELGQQGKSEQAAILAQVATDVTILQRSGDLPTDAVAKRLHAAICASGAYREACKDSPPP